MSVSRFETNQKIKGLIAELAEKVHPWEADHAERVQVYAVATGAEMGMSEPELESLKVAAALHDIGKLEWPEGPWADPVRHLLEGESDRVRQHSIWGADRLAKEGYSSDICQMVLHHHEKLDGSGYPEHLEGSAVAIGARVIGIAEYFDGFAFGPWSNEGADEARKWIMASWPGLWGSDVHNAFLKVERLIQPVHV